MVIQGKIGCSNVLEAFLRIDTYNDIDLRRNGPECNLVCDGCKKNGNTKQSVRKKTKRRNHRQ